MRVRKGIALVLLTLGMTMAFAACGDKKEDTTTGGGATTEAVATEAQTKGTTGSWGNFAEIMIPDGMKLTGGSQTDKEDQNALWIQEEANLSNYFLISIVDSKDKAEMGVNGTKEMNKDSNPQDVSLSAGDMNWTGVAYKYDNRIDCVHMYCQKGDKVMTVLSGGYAYDSDISKAILGSIKLK